MRFQPQNLSKTAYFPVVAIDVGGKGVFAVGLPVPGVDQLPVGAEDLHVNVQEPTLSNLNKTVKLHPRFSH